VRPHRVVEQVDRGGDANRRLVRRAERTGEREMKELSVARTVMLPLEAAANRLLRISASTVFAMRLMVSVPARPTVEFAPVPAPTEPVTATISALELAVTERAPACVRFETVSMDASVSFEICVKPIAAPTPALPPNPAEPAIRMMFVLSSASTVSAPSMVPVVFDSIASVV
jgi:hypothetical protein